MPAKKKVPTIDERLDAIDRRLEGVTQTLELVAAMQVKTGTELEKLEAMQVKTDKRIDRLFTITLKIGADFAERIKALEDEDDKERGAN